MNEQVTPWAVFSVLAFWVGMLLLLWGLQPMRERQKKRPACEAGRRWGKGRAGAVVNDGDHIEHGQAYEGPGVLKFHHDGQLIGEQGADAAGMLPAVAADGYPQAGFQVADRKRGGGHVQRVAEL